MYIQRVLVDYLQQDILGTHLIYRKVTSLDAHPGFFRLLLEGILDPYVLWPFDKKLISYLVLMQPNFSPQLNCLDLMIKNTALLMQKNLLVGIF